MMIDLTMKMTMKGIPGRSRTLGMARWRMDVLELSVEVSHITHIERLRY